MEWDEREWNHIKLLLLSFRYFYVVITIMEGWRNMTRAKVKRKKKDIEKMVLALLESGANLKILEPNIWRMSSN